MSQDDRVQTDTLRCLQRLEVTSSGTVTGSGEVQVVTISGDLSGSFIVGFNGAFTG